MGIISLLKHTKDEHKVQILLCEWCDNRDVSTVEREIENYSFEKGDYTEKANLCLDCYVGYNHEMADSAEEYFNDFIH